MHPVLADASEVQQFTHQLYSLGGVSITILVMAFSRVSAKDQHTVEAAAQTFNNMDRIHPPAAHGQHGTDAGGILKPGDSGQVCGGV
jgi:hypothetical protein